MKKQFLSILLALVMVISIIPINTFAGDSSSGNSTTESYDDFIDGEQVLRDMIEKTDCTLILVSLCRMRNLQN